MIICKCNVLELLKKNGFSAYRLSKDKIIGADRIQRLRQGKVPSWRELDIICKLTAHDIGDIIQYMPEKA